MTEQQTEISFEPTFQDLGNGRIVVDEGDSAYVLSSGAVEQDAFLQDEHSTSESVEPQAEADLDLSIFENAELEAPQETASEEKPEDKPEPIEFTKFKEDFKKHLGLDLEEAVSAVQELKTLRMELYVREQEQVIKDSWAVDKETFNERMTAVREYAKKLKPEVFAKLDNADGVKLIWAKLESEQKKAQPKEVPTVQRNSTRTTAAQPKFEYTYSQIQKMSRAEYEANAAKIARAFATNKVDLKR